MLEKIYKYHNEWILIALSFVNNKEDAEDLVQEMYIRLNHYEVKIDDIRYKDSVNKLFIYTVIRNMALRFLKNKKRIDFTELTLEAFNKHTPEIQEISEEEILFGKIEKEIENWHWYDRTLFEMYMFSGLSMRDIAYGTIKIPKALSNESFLHECQVRIGSEISLSSLFNTIKKCKLILKEKL
jgi:RNA polymerase sigma factor (sigma-70 family)